MMLLTPTAKLFDNDKHQLLTCPPPPRATNISSGINDDAIRNNGPPMLPMQSLDAPQHNHAHLNRFAPRFSIQKLTQNVNANMDPDARRKIWGSLILDFEDNVNEENEDSFPPSPPMIPSQIGMRRIMTTAEEYKEEGSLTGFFLIPPCPTTSSVKMLQPRPCTPRCPVGRSWNPANSTSSTPATTITATHPTHPTATARPPKNITLDKKSVHFATDEVKRRRLGMSIPLDGCRRRPSFPGAA